EVVVPGRGVDEREQQHREQVQPAPPVGHQGALPQREQDDRRQDEQEMEAEVGHRAAAERVEMAGCPATGSMRRSRTRADESTPGTPAPGWVPAPTKYRPS